MAWICIICEQEVEIIREGKLHPACWPNINGGTIRLDFGYGSRFDQCDGMSGSKTEYQGCICDDCFEQKKDLCRQVEITTETKWKLISDHSV